MGNISNQYWNDGLIFSICYSYIKKAGSPNKPFSLLFQTKKKKRKEAIGWFANNKNVQLYLSQAELACMVSTIVVVHIAS